jgi:ATP-binding cassette subfamily F protein uup
MERFPQGLDTPIAPLSGGERRRIALAKLLLDGLSCSCSTSRRTTSTSRASRGWRASWRAPRVARGRHPRPLVPRRGLHPTWEVSDGSVHQYEGGYAAYTLARAERERQAAAQDARRQQLLRKELAWLRRGPPARTSKPKFRIEAANALIADEPEPRDGVELLRFASARLGGKVIDAERRLAGLRREGPAARRDVAPGAGRSRRARRASTARARRRC